MGSEFSRAAPLRRLDIDGLRAIAILAVVLYHIDHDLLPGGYVGVDVFFAISGFLITGLVKREQALGVFSLADFYARRVKRLAPALALVLLVTMAVSVFVLFPRDLILRLRSLLPVKRMPDLHSHALLPTLPDARDLPS